jgi:putative MATE family efflux protein
VSAPRETTAAPEPRARRILEGPLGRELLRFGAPLALGAAVQTLLNLVDPYVLAELPPGERSAAIGALGVCDQIGALGTIISFGVSTATATRIGTQVGAGDPAGARHTLMQSFCIVGALSLFFGCGAFVAPELAGQVIGLKGAVAVVAGRYLQIMLAGSFSAFLILQLTSVLRALGSSLWPTVVLVLGTLLNAVLSVVLVFGEGGARLWEREGMPAHPLLAWGGPIAGMLHLPRCGMLGTAWATLAARAFMLVALGVLLLRRRELRAPAKAPAASSPRSAPAWRLDGPEIRRILALAWPSSAQFVLRVLAAILVSSLAARAYTTETDQAATTAMSMVLRVDSLATFVAMGWGTAAQTFVAQNLGAKATARAVRSGWLAAGYGIATALLVWLLLVWKVDPILRLFGKDESALAIAALYIRIVAPTYLLLAIGIVLGSAMTGAGATRTTLVIDACTLLLVQIPACFVAVYGLRLPIAGLFAAVALGALVGAASYVVVFARRRWLPAGSAS